jgi:hypothetical protein
MPDARRLTSADRDAADGRGGADDRRHGVVEPLLRGYVAWAAAQLPQYGVAADASLAGELAGTPRLQGWWIGARQTRRS